MSVYPRAVNRFTSVVLSHDTRPSSTQGATITPAQNSYGSYATVLGTPLAADAYEIEIIVREIGINGQATDSLTTIGIDRAGGTSYTDTIQHLLVSYAGSIAQGHQLGIRYRFPLFIPAGSTIGAKGSINNATVGTQLVAVRLFCKPTHPELLRLGRYVRTFGQDTANSRGTAVTFGTTSEGSWTSIGTVADPNLFAWSAGFAPSNLGVQGAGRGDLDLALGDASNKREYVTASEFSLNTLECCEGTFNTFPGECANGETIYVRGQSSNSTTAWSAIVYAVGG